MSFFVYRVEQQIVLIYNFFIFKKGVQKIYE